MSARPPLVFNPIPCTLDTLYRLIELASQRHKQISLFLLQAVEISLTLAPSPNDWEQAVTESQRIFYDTRNPLPYHDEEPTE